MTVKQFEALSAEYCKAVGRTDRAKQHAEKMQWRATVAQAVAIQKDFVELGLKNALRTAKRALRAERVCVDAS